MDDTAFSTLSDSIEARVQGAAPLVAALAWDGGQLSAVLWRDNVLVTSEQSLPRSGPFEAVLPGGARVPATLAGRDPTTNVAVLNTTATASTHQPAEPRGAGGLVLAVGSDGAGHPTARLGVVEVLGGAWESQRGGRIDRLIRIGVRLPGGAEGGPVLDARGGLLGMSTFGPRRGVMVIPMSTVSRAADLLLRGGKMERGWLGVGLHPVELPREIAAKAGVESGLMVVNMAEGAPAVGRLLPGDILTAIDGTAVTHPRNVASLLGPETVGQSKVITVVRGGEVARVDVVIGARPE